MSTLDHGWNPQWSKAVIMFGYYYSERMIWRLLDQLPVNVLQGKLCAICNLISRLLPCSYTREHWNDGRGVGTTLSMHTYIMCIYHCSFFFYQNVCQLHSCLGTSTCSGGCYIHWVHNQAHQFSKQFGFTLANGGFLKSANRALFTSLILCLKNMCTTR